MLEISWGTQIHLAQHTFIFHCIPLAQGSDGEGNKTEAYMPSHQDTQVSQ